MYYDEGEGNCSTTMEPWVPTFGSEFTCVIQEQHIMFIQKIDDQLQYLYDQMVENYKNMDNDYNPKEDDGDNFFDAEQEQEKVSNNEVTLH